MAEQPLTAAAAKPGLNVVRPGRPEQSSSQSQLYGEIGLSQCSPAWKTGTMARAVGDALTGICVSM